MDSNTQHKTNIWYSFQGEYSGNEPFFYDAEQLPWLTTLEANFSTIKLELESFLKLKNNSIAPYFNNNLVNNKNDWKLAAFYFWGERDSEHCQHIPKTDKLLNNIPGFLSAGLSILNANTNIKPHIGDTDAVIRVHLALKIPEGLPACGLKVGTKEQAWQEGKTLAFCDAHYHSAWNNTNENRYVLILDVLHPELLNKKDEVARNVKSLIKLQQLDLKYPFLKKCPGFIRGIVRKLFT